MGWIGSIGVIIWHIWQDLSVRIATVHDMTWCDDMLVRVVREWALVLVGTERTMLDFRKVKVEPGCPTRKNIQCERIQPNVQLDAKTIRIK